jgi:hypothetical protein|uniref:Uncharacterized protein n=1 Tax=Sipha flava TaxID=143950 RepID=A0A2S2R0P8_9HEMI
MSGVFNIAKKRRKPYKSKVCEVGGLKWIAQEIFLRDETKCNEWRPNINDSGFGEKKERSIKGQKVLRHIFMLYSRNLTIADEKKHTDRKLGCIQNMFGQRS